MRPFRVEIPAADLDDLNRRLAATRWPGELAGVGWQRGVPLGYLKELAQYWRESFDWRAAEAWMNTFPQFLTEIDGTTVHFVHVRSEHPGATPVILTHGWPGSPLEFLHLVERLTDPVRHGGDAADAFHVVIPTIPGFGFSGPTPDTGWDVARVARAFARLMADLGYERYVAQGGDWGKVISLQLGLVDPEHVAGVHLNMLVTFPPPDDPGAIVGLGPADLARLQHGAEFADTGLGWQRIQSTRPQTLAYALTDSPVGQLAWIAEKFYEWSGATQAPEDVIDRDTMLANVTLYWLTATAGSSAQLYYETTPTMPAFVATWGGPWPLQAPVAVAVFPDDATRPVLRFAEKALPTLTRWTEFPAGGHFAALEQPDLLVGDLRAFTRSLR